jgi:hypothetical protein
MCDFAADAAAAEQLMVGRTLSVARVRELNAKRVFIRALLGFGIKPEEVKVMLQDNPAKLMWLDE